jgi:hypothetical protein
VRLDHLLSKEPPVYLVRRLFCSPSFFVWGVGGGGWLWVVVELWLVLQLRALLGPEETGPCCFVGLVFFGLAVAGCCGGWSGVAGFLSFV